jgi:hypothetical protein
MTTKTLGTNATTTLTAVQWLPTLSDADVASINALIFDAQVIANSGVQRPIVALGKGGTLYVPSRGTLQLQPNDWVCVDPTCGAVFALPYNAVASAAGATGTWASGGSALTMTTSVLASGWFPGMTVVASSMFSAGTFITSIAAGGTSLTINQAAGTSSAGGGSAVTAGNFTHS